MNESAVGNATRACPKCNATNLSDAKYCGRCGAALDGSPPAPDPPPNPGPQQPYVPPRPVVDLQQFGAVGGGGTPFQVSLGLAEAYERLMSRIRGGDVEIEWEQPPSGARFVAYYKDFINTAGTRVKYAGNLTLQEVSPGVSTVRLGLSLNWGSTVPLLVGVAMLGIMLALTNLMFAPYMFLFVIVVGAGVVWQCSSQFPAKLMNRWKQGLPMMTGQAPGAMAGARPPPSQAPAPVSRPPPPPSAAPPAAPGESRPSPVERLKQLNELKEAGAITQEDYDAKKQEILQEL